MPEVMIRQLMQHLRKSHNTQLGMLPDAFPRCGGKRMQKNGERPAEGDKLFERIAGGSGPKV